MLLAILAVTTGVSTTQPMDGSTPETMRVLLPAWMLGQIIMIAVSAAVGAVCFRHGLNRGMGLTTRRWWWDLARSIVGFFVVIPGVLLLMLGTIMLLQVVRPEWIKLHSILTFLPQAAPIWRVVAVVTAVVLAPVAEEMFFRGLLQSMLKRRLHGRAWVAILIASAVFAIAHINQPQAIPSLFLLSVALGYNYERTGRLTGPILMHAIFNGVMIFYLAKG